MAGCIHCAICNAVGLQVTHKYYEHIPERVTNVSGTAVMWDIQKTEKPSKYKDLAIEGSRMWKVRTKIMPVIIGALGAFKKGLDRNLQLLLGHLAAIDLRSSH
jgi:hypothetical protein